MSVVCCVNNKDILQKGHDYSNLLENNYSEDKYSTILQVSENEKLPLSQIKYSNPDFSGSFSELPITSKYAIIRKDCSPLEDYDIISRLGEGTYGKVFKVRNKTSKIIRAMKQISKYNMSDIGQNKIMEEIEILKKLNHIYIIKLYEYYVTKDFIYLINELSNEGDLQSKFSKIKIFPESIAKIIMFQIFKALQYLNEKSIIHGDLKLENILVVSYNNNDNINETKNNKKTDGFIEAIKHDMKIINEELNTLPKTNTFNKFDQKYINNFNKNLKEFKQKQNINSYGTNIKFPNNFHAISKQENKIKEGINKNKEKSNKPNIIHINSRKFHIYNYGIKLIDFGCSKIFTRTRKYFNDIVGTLVYCSPEVLLGDYDKSCDIWSCGVILYYLLSGYFPFYGQTEDGITNKIIESKFEFDIKEFNNISEEAKDLIKKCLKKDKNKRITVQQALEHPFFDEIKNVTTFTEEEKEILKKLKKLGKHSKFYQLVLTYFSYNFSDNKLLKELNQLFNKLDKKTDYKITKNELYKAFKEANIEITIKEIENIINSMDFDANGDIDYEEFIRMCIPQEKLFTENNLRKAFRMFDSENKGVITPLKIIDFIESYKAIPEELKSHIKKEIIDFAEDIMDYDDFKAFMLGF